MLSERKRRKGMIIFIERESLDDGCFSKKFIDGVQNCEVNRSNQNKILVQAYLADGNGFLMELPLKDEKVKILLGTDEFKFIDTFIW